MNVANIVDSLKGLPLDEFFEESYKQLLLRDPEGITYLGLAEEVGIRNNALTDISDAYIRETHELERALLHLLRTYNRDEVRREQQLSYDVYEWILDDLVQRHEFMYYNYPVHHFLAGFHDRITRFFTEIHPLRHKQDFEDYISRLSQLRTKIEQLIEGLNLREKAGVVPPRFIIKMTKDLMITYLRMDSDQSEPESISLYTVFCENLDAMHDLSPEEKQKLRNAALKEVKETFIPAYETLLSYLEHQESIATDDAGVWKFPKGDAYYRYVLRKETSTELTPEEIHDIGLREVKRIQKEMRAVFDELGYPPDESFSQLMERVITDAGFYNTSTESGKDNVVKAYETILEESDQRLSTVVDIRPRKNVVVYGDVRGRAGGFYESASHDGSRPGRFHAGVGGPHIQRYNMKTVAYHEAVPGHHFQIALAQELDLPRFRNVIQFNGYSEGWALYAEQLAWELGLYEDDPYGNIGRLQFELLRAVRLVVDTGIHAQKWTREKAVRYMNDVLGARKGTFSHEVDRFIVLPGQATGYKVGMLKILELRQKARTELGTKLDIKKFHAVILGHGSMPLNILEDIVQEYIDAQKKDSLPPGG